MPRLPIKVSYYNPVIETMSREELLGLQWKRLKNYLEYLYHKNPYYRRRFDESKVTPGDINSMGDFIEKVPITTKADMVKDQEEFPPYGLRLGVHESKLLLIMTTSGTSGMGQEVYGLTRADFDLTTLALAFYWAGVRPGEVCISTIPTSIGSLLAAPTTVHYGLIKLGANFINLGLTYRTEQKVIEMKRFSPHFLYALSGHYLRRLATACKEQGIEPRRDYPRLKSVSCLVGGASIEWLQEMEEFWDAKIYESYGSTQTRTTFGYTCERGALVNGRRGIVHLFGHMFLVEILNRATRQPVAPGEEGEVVLTPLWIEASPVLRFATNDKARYLPHDACECGRPFDGIESGSLARYDDMMKVKGTNIWPQAIEAIVFAHSEIEEYQMKVWVESDGAENVLVTVEFKKDVPEQGKKKLLIELPHKLKEKVGIDIMVKESERPLPRFEYKAVRWLDERQKGLKRILF